MLFFIFIIYYSPCLSILILCQPLCLSQFLSHKWGSRNVMSIFYEIQSYAISGWLFSVFCILMGQTFLKQGLISIYSLHPQHLHFKSDLNRGWYINFFCLYWHEEFVISFLETWWTQDSLLCTIHATTKLLCRNEVLITVLLLVLEYVKLMGLFCFHVQAILNIDLKLHCEKHSRKNSLTRSIALSYKCLSRKEQRSQKLRVILVSSQSGWTYTRCREGLS